MDSFHTETEIEPAASYRMTPENELLTDIERIKHRNNPSVVNPSTTELVVDDKKEQTNHYSQSTDTLKKDWTLLKTQVFDSEDSAKIEAIENTVLEQLQKPNSTSYDIEGALEVLLELCLTFERPRLDVVNIILELMQNYPQEFNIHDLSLSILSNLKGWIHPTEKDFENIIERSICSMETFPNSKKLFKTFLSILDVGRWDHNLLMNTTTRCTKLICERLNFFSAELGIGGAESGVGGTESGIGGAELGIRGAESGIRGAESGIRGAVSGVGGAESGIGDTVCAPHTQNQI